MGPDINDVEAPEEKKEPPPRVNVPGQSNVGSGGFGIRYQGGHSSRVFNADYR